MFNSPTVIEMKDIDDIPSMTYSPDTQELLVTIKLKEGKAYHPQMLALSDNGIPRLFSPVMSMNVPATTITIQQVQEAVLTDSKTDQLQAEVATLQALKNAIVPTMPTMPPVSAVSDVASPVSTQSSNVSPVPPEVPQSVPSVPDVPKKNGKAVVPPDVAPTSNDSDVPLDETVAAPNADNGVTN